MNSDSAAVQNCAMTRRVNKNTVGTRVIPANLVVEHSWRLMVILDDTVGNCDFLVNTDYAAAQKCVIMGKANNTVGTLVFLANSVVDAQKSYEVFPRGSCYILNSTGTVTNFTVIKIIRESTCSTIRGTLTNHIQLCW